MNMKRFIIHDKNSDDIHDVPETFKTISQHRTPHHPSKSKEHFYSSFSNVNLEIQEALIFEQIIKLISKMISVSIYSISDCVRILSDTIVGIVNVSIKSIGGIFNLFGNVLVNAVKFLKERDNHLQKTFVLFPIHLYYLFFITVLNAFINGSLAFSKFCIVLGDTLEFVSISLGQSLEDSFVGLIHALSFFKNLLIFSLRSNYGNISMDNPWLSYNDNSINIRKEVPDLVMQSFKEAKLPSANGNIGSSSGLTVHSKFKLSKKPPISWDYERVRNIQDEKSELPNKTNDQSQIKDFNATNSTKQSSCDSSLYHLSSTAAFNSSLKNIPFDTPPKDTSDLVPKKLYKPLNVSSYSIFQSMFNAFRNNESSNEIPTIRGHLFGGLLVLFIVTYVFSCNESSKISQENSTKSISRKKYFSENFLIRHAYWKRRFIPLLFFFAIWMYLSFIDSVYRQRLIQSTVIDTSIKLYEMQDEAALHDMESLRWVNRLVTSMWTSKQHVTKHQLYQSELQKKDGLGAYLDTIIFSVVNRQLSLMPSSVANVQLKAISIGVKPPVLLNIKILSRNEMQNCLQYGNPVILQHYNESKLMNETKINEQDHFRIPLLKFVESFSKHFAQAFMHINEVSNTYSNSDDNTPKRNNMKDISSTKLCDQAIVDIEFAYTSENMDLILTLRPIDVKSALPEAKVSVSAMSMQGHIRMHIDIIDEYPFVGNGTFSFLELPKWEITVASFGVSDLSSIPGVYHWINVTMSWLLQQVS